MKRAMITLLAAAMILTLAACGGVANSVMDAVLAELEQATTAPAAAEGTTAADKATTTPPMAPTTAPTTVPTTAPTTSAEEARAEAERAAQEMLGAIQAAFDAKDWELVVSLVGRAEASLADHPEGEKAAALCEDALEQIKKAGEATLANLNTSYDKVRKITWYQHKNRPKYIDTACYIYPYIGRTDSGTTGLRVKLNYTGDTWLFYDNVIYSVDGENTTQKFDYGDVTRDNDTEVWETADFTADNSVVALLIEIANSDETIIRFRGDKYYYDHTVTVKEKAAILEVLAAFDYLSTVPAGQ